MTSLNVASIQFFKRKITQPPVHSQQSTSSPVHSYQSPVYSHQSPLTTNISLRPSRVPDTMVLVYRHKPITRTDRNYSPLTTISSFRLNRVLDTMALVYRHKPITRTDRNYSPFTNHQNPLHHYTITPLATHLSPLTTNSSLRPSRVLDTMVLVYRHKPITRTDRNYSPLTTILLHH